MQKEVLPAGPAGASSPRARNRTDAHPAPATPQEGQLSAAEARTDLNALNAEAPFGSAPGEGTDPGAEGEVGSAELPRLTAAAGDAGAPEPEPADPEALLMLADMAIGAVGMLAPSHVQLPPELTRLTDGEKAMLRPLAVRAAPRFGDYTAMLDKYAPWIFLGAVGIYGALKLKAIDRLVKAAEAQAPRAPSSGPQPFEAPAEDVAAAAHSGVHPSIMPMPGSPVA